MKIQNLQTQSFSGHKYMPNKQMELIHKTLNRIDENNFMKMNPDTFQRESSNEIIRKVETENISLFQSCWSSKVKHPNKYLMGKTYIESASFMIEVDNGTSRILKYKKPFLISWNKFMNNLLKHLQDLDYDFYNPNYVKLEKIEVRPEKLEKVLWKKEQ